MNTIKRAIAAPLLGLRWLLLAVAGVAVWLAEVAKEAAERVRR